VEERRLISTFFFCHAGSLKSFAEQHGMDAMVKKGKESKQRKKLVKKLAKKVIKKAKKEAKKEANAD
jgi:hypothetical protein